MGIVTVMNALPSKLVPVDELGNTRFLGMDLLIVWEN